MKSFLIKFLFFICPFIIYLIFPLLLLPILIEKTEGPSTESQIRKSFQNAKNKHFDLLILGNSGIYRGINPDMINIPSYNFSHDNDSFNQMYYKLLWLEQQGINFKYLILGVDYFQFSFISDTRNYAYGSYFMDDYLKDYKSTNIVKSFISKKNIFDFKRLKYLMNVFRKKQDLIFQKDNGQYIKPGKAFPVDKYFYSIKRLPIQEKYFKMIFEYCNRKQIEAFICMLPIRQNALINYQENEIQEFNNFIHFTTNSNRRFHFLDYSHQPGWNIEDYTDITHLNEEAADRFSKQLNDTIIHSQL